MVGGGMRENIGKGVTGQELVDGIGVIEDSTEVEINENGFKKKING